MLAILLAGAFVGLALATAIWQPVPALASWLPLHLLLAGAAGTAISGVMPFFSAAVSGAPAANRAVRLSGILAVAGGALLVSAGWAVAGSAAEAGRLLAGGGGLVYLAGLLCVTAATLLPLRVALGPRRIFMGAVYGVALLNVLSGATLATLFVLDWPPVLAAWATLKPAHAWLNVFGFISLVIAGSLLHLLPTVVGARIRRTIGSAVAFAGLGSGPLLVAAGFVLESAAVGLIGAGFVVMGAGGFCWHALVVMRNRASWSGDHSWHRFTTSSLVAGIAWFLLGTLLATAQVVGAGATAAGWRLEPLIAPLAIGWAGQVLVGAWSHLLPAIGPGDQQVHARQRQLLGRAATLRLVLLNGGVAAVVLGGPLGMPTVAATGLAAALIAAALAVALLLAAAGLVLSRPWFLDRPIGSRRKDRWRTDERPTARAQGLPTADARGGRG